MNDADLKRKATFSGFGGLGYLRSKSPLFLERAADEARFLDDRRRFGLDPYQTYVVGRSGPSVKRGLRGAIARQGLNFGTQDYLSLGGHPALREAVENAALRHGVHSGGSAALAGNSDMSLALERDLAEWLGFADATLFPIGWAAGYGLITSLVLPEDHVVIDRLAHACLQDGARAATNNVRQVPHRDNSAIAAAVADIRGRNADCGILVVTETLFSMDSDVPDIVELQAICDGHSATLLVDCAHDLGAMEEDGLGILRRQGMVGRVDILVGAFSKSFASIGGFVASNEPGLKLRLRTAGGPSTFTNAMTPLQVAAIGAAIGIIARRKATDVVGG